MPYNDSVERIGQGKPCIERVLGEKGTSLEWRSPGEPRSQAVVGLYSAVAPPTAREVTAQVLSDLSEFQVCTFPSTIATICFDLNALGLGLTSQSRGSLVLFAYWNNNRVESNGVFESLDVDLKYRIESIDFLAVSGVDPSPISLEITIPLESELCLIG
ncbi:hypothetical protein RRG08_044808 [Elysia crispata]|uniref:Uncharacterized protein n=1 Tax=Elysia crispata TaxID=231223 RepID=A0AAE0ZXH2_9GAST|nr:hypothetical protein RRG08_044808 [Elysia crispata]